MDEIKFPFLVTRRNIGSGDYRRDDSAPNCATRRIPSFRRSAQFLRHSEFQRRHFQPGFFAQRRRRFGVFVADSWQSHANRIPGSQGKLAVLGAVSEHHLRRLRFHPLSLGTGIDHLLWDRLPIVIAIAALLSAALVERLSRTAGLWALPLLVVLAVLSVLYWYWTEQQGAGNLNFYIVM
jgi:hypothetical protein